MKGEPRNDDLVLLGMAGIPEPEILAQLKTLTRSPAFENQDRAKDLLQYLVKAALAGRVPRVDEITKAVFGKEYYPGDTQTRNTLSKLRTKLQQHYAQNAKRDEIRLYFRDREYIAFTVRSTSGNDSLQRRRLDSGPPGDVILEPKNNVEVHHLTQVRGKLDVLSLDTRAWLVVKIPVGLYYPQCRVSRVNPEWQHEIRIGLRKWGADEGAQYEIQLVAAGDDGDIEFYQYLREGRDGFGFVLPSDCRVLDTRRVIRRDVRPGQTTASA